MKKKVSIRRETQLKNEIIENLKHDLQNEIPVCNKDIRA